MIEIIVITYNRADHLKRTLEAIVPHRDQVERITVLDNASTDATEEVCRAFGSAVEHKRNKFNIGLEANLLRAWETAKADYLWVLCDDDEYKDLGVGLLNVKARIAQTSPDIVLVSGVGRLRSCQLIQWSMKMNLLAESSGFYSSISFPPAVIIKTSAFEAKDFFLGYKSIYNYYSYIPFFGRLIAKNACCAVADYDLVIRPSTSEAAFPLFDVAVGWMIMNQYIPARYHRFSLYALIGPETPFRSLLTCLLRQRLDWGRPTWQVHLRGLAGVPKSALLVLVLLLPFSFMPNIFFWVIRWVYDAYKKARGIHRSRSHIKKDDLLRT